MLPQQNMFTQLDSIDKKIFLWINQQSTNSFFDAVLPFFRYDKNWIPLYIILILLAIKQEQRKVWLWILFAIATVLLTDQVSSHIIKPLVQRLRPCTDPLFRDKVRVLVNHCSNGYSFTSSHATNHFGIALFFLYSLKKSLQIWRFVLIAWAAIIAYAQVYVGVHYPFDVLCGSFLGIFLGTLTSKIYLTIYNKKFVTTKL